MIMDKRECDSNEMANRRTPGRVHYALAILLLIACVAGGTSLMVEYDRATSNQGHSLKVPGDSVFSAPASREYSVMLEIPIADEKPATMNPWAILPHDFRMSISDLTARGNAVQLRRCVARGGRQIDGVRYAKIGDVALLEGHAYEIRTTGSFSRSETISILPSVESDVWMVFLGVLIIIVGLIGSAIWCGIVFVIRFLAKTNSASVGPLRNAATEGRAADEGRL